jgi:hypothetical protein
MDATAGDRAPASGANDDGQAGQALPLRVEWAADPGAVAAAISDERLVGLYTFWLGLDTFPLLPSARAIVADELLRVWPNVAIADLEGGRVRYRRVGGDLVAKLGMNASGHLIDEVARGTKLALLEALYELCRDARAAVYSQTCLAPPGEALVVHRLMLPLSDDGRTVQTILCGQTYVRPGGGPNPGSVGALALRERDEAECRAWVDSAQAAAMHADRDKATRPALRAVSAP